MVASDHVKDRPVAEVEAAKPDTCYIEVVKMKRWTNIYHGWEIVEASRDTICD